MHNRFDSSGKKFEREHEYTPRESFKHVNKVPSRIVCTVMILIILLILCFGVALAATGYYHFSQTEDMGILVPKFDKRRFQHLVLPNLIETVLVHDPKAKTGSAAISVGVGSHDNPTELPGLAHLLEHMLFLGSSKYPEHAVMEKL